MAFYRFKDPTYDAATGWTSGANIDGIPYSYINVVSEGVGALGSAFVDGPLQGGVNPGTLLVGFTEDGKSSSVNRGLKALAESSDHLDDLLHRDIAVPKRSGSLIGTDNITVQIGFGDVVYVGTQVGKTTVESYRLFQVTDSSGRPLTVPLGNAFATVTAWAEADEGTTWASQPVLTFNYAIPSGVTYIVWYYYRKDLASQNADMLLEYSAEWRGRTQELIKNISEGEHAFFGEKTFNDIVTLSAGVDDGVAVNTGNLDVTLGSLILAAGDVFLNGVGARIRLLDPSQRLTFVDDQLIYIGVSARTTTLNIFEGAQGDFVAETVGLGATAAGDKTFVPIALPHGAILSSLRVEHNQGDAAANVITIRRRGGIGESTLILETQSNNHGASLGVYIDTFNSGPDLPHQVDNTLYSYVLEFEAGHVDAILYQVEVTWTDPGPRNH